MTIHLQLRGVVALKDGTAVSVVLGEGDEPKFVINDLLPHLGGEQGKKPLNEAIAGETLNILMGSRPLGDSEDSDRVKLRVLDLLHEKYGICEDDLTSAELEVVPAFNATDIGLDGSLIGAYGHDDRAGAGDPHQDRRLYAGGQGGDRLHGRHRYAVRLLRYLYGGSVRESGRCPAGVL